MVVPNLKKISFLLLTISADSFAPNGWRQVDRHALSAAKPDLTVSESREDTIERNDGNTYNSDKREECPMDYSEQSYETLVEEMAESIDIARETASLESLSSYIVVSCLTASSSVSVCLGVFDISNATFEASLFHYLIVGVATISAIAGIYSTVVFSLCATYGLTAIGLRKDPMYQSFMENSQPYRLKGFISYLTSLSLFLCEIILISADQMNAAIRYPYLGIISIISLLVYRDWVDIVKLASPLFSSEMGD